MLYSKDIFIFLNGQMLFDIDKCSLLMETKNPHVSLEVIFKNGESELYAVEKIKPLGKTIKIDVVTFDQIQNLSEKTKVINLTSWKQQSR